MRSISLSTRALVPTTSLNASAMSPSMPSHEPGSRCEKSPRPTARSALRSCRLAWSAPVPVLPFLAAPLVGAAGRFPLVFVLPAAATGGIRILSYRARRTTTHDAVGPQCVASAPTARTLIASKLPVDGYHERARNPYIVRTAPARTSPASRPPGRLTIGARRDARGSAAARVYPSRWVRPGRRTTRRAPGRRARGESRRRASRWCPTSWGRSSRRGRAARR